MLALLAESIFAYIDELSAASAEGFAREQSAAAGEADRRRAALARLLIQHPPADPAEVELAARDAGMELPDRLAAVVWAPREGDRTASWLPMGSLAVADGELSYALVPDPDAPMRRAEIARAFGRRAAALGPSVRWQDAARSALRATEVHRLTAAGVIAADGLVRAEDHLTTLLIERDPSLLSELAERRLAPLTEASTSARARLLETLEAWLEHHGSVPEVARAIHVHPQTVRYRLNQLRNLFGDDLDDPDARFELMVVTRARTLRGASWPGELAPGAARLPDHEDDGDQAQEHEQRERQVGAARASGLAGEAVAPAAGAVLVLRASSSPLLSCSAASAPSTSSTHSSASRPQRRRTGCGAAP